MPEMKPDFVFTDLKPKESDFLSDALEGLHKPQKQLSPKFFYDEAGSKLYDRICHLEEYYPARTEIGIMNRLAPEMAERIGEGALLVEYGSGSSNKTTPILSALKALGGYAPIDISKEHLLESARQIARDFPQLDLYPICADFTRPFPLPQVIADYPKRVGFFPGSTVGNFTPAKAKKLLENIASMVGTGGYLLIGADLQKDISVIEAAYNDREGVTAAFNKNVLRRINTELGGDFDLDAFSHKAIWDPKHGRIEMRLYSDREQVLTLGGKRIPFAQGEHILTEYSHKYPPEGFSKIADDVGFRVVEIWTDERAYFSVNLLQAS